MKKRKINKNYRRYKTKEGEVKHTHARVGEKKYGYDNIPKGFVIHHIDKNKENNQYYNLILLHKKDHKRIHKTKSLIITLCNQAKKKINKI